MNRRATDVSPFAGQDPAELESYLADRLAAAAGLLGVALIEIDTSDWASAVERLTDHVDAEDHATRIGDNRFVIVRSPLVGPAEMEGLGLRIADSFPSSTVHVGVVTARDGDTAQTLLRHVEFGLDDAKAIAQPVVVIDDRPTTTPEA